MKKSISVAAVLVGLLGAPLQAQAADMVVIVHPQASVSSIDAGDVKKLFLGKSKKLPNGSKALLVTLDSLGSDFNKAALGKSDAQVRSAWSRLVFSGKAQPPKEFGAAADVIEYVSQNENAIGFIAASDLTDAVKAVHSVR